MLVIHAEGPLRIVSATDAYDRPVAGPRAADDVLSSVHVPAVRRHRHCSWVRRQLRFSKTIRRGQGMSWRPARWMATALLLAFSMPPGVFADSINDKIDK